MSPSVSRPSRESRPCSPRHNRLAAGPAIGASSPLNKLGSDQKLRNSSRLCRSEKLIAPASCIAARGERANWRLFK